MTEYTIEPEVAGGLGPSSDVDSSVHPPLVRRLEYEFAGWLGDDLVESFPCLVITDRLAQHLVRSGISGFELDAVTVTVTDEFREHFAGDLPAFRWLKVTGSPGQDDLWMGDDLLLHASEAGVAALRTGQLDNAVVEQV